MSVMVLLIAFVPAIAVVVATEFTHNRVVIVGIAMVAAAIGVFVNFHAKLTRHFHLKLTHPLT